MKKRITITVLALFIVASSAFAQDYKSTVSADAGISLIGVLMRAVVNVDTIDGYSATPAMQLSYDYMVTDFLSAGAAASFQQFKFSDTEGSFAIKRMNFAIRALFHYGKSDKLDMYSGIRLGMTNWGYKIDIPTNDPTLTALQDSKFSGLGFAPQLIAFGVRGYFTDNIGANIEFAVGAPYYMMGGVNYRF
ncbi:MAG: hypothetical protein DRI94_00965 [Bacteroidetes bacterium]|nr:MAG: hypothetical protein DRI94_00965 [Bacteroidota bacterium]